MEKTVNILGTTYTIKEQSEKDNKLLEGCDGYCDYTTKEIVVEREIQGTLQDMEVYINPTTERTRFSIHTRVKPKRLQIGQAFTA